MGDEVNIPPEVLRYGRPESLPKQHALRAGPLTLVFAEGDLRTIRFGSLEVVRRVYVTVRDHVWNTIPASISQFCLDLHPNSFHITFEARNQQGMVDFAWRGTVTGDAQGTITFVFDGIAYTTFRRNRIGICVLLPIRECAGQACTVEKVDGTKEQGEFPKMIMPHQPFTDIRALSYKVTSDIAVEIRFTGETFEMEDQRNWTDASFKIYPTPLRIPYPVEVRSGTRLRQAVKIVLSGQINAPIRNMPNEPPVLVVGDSPVTKLPRIGLGMASHHEALSPLQLARLRRLNLSHLRVDVHLGRPDWTAAFEHAWNEARALGISLEVALFLSERAERELNQLIGWLEQTRPRVCAWLIFHATRRSTDKKWLFLARQYLVRFDNHAQIGTGSNVHFAELNRAHPPIDLIDFVCYPITPQAHLFDNDTIIENLSTQAETVSTTRTFSGTLPIIVTPVTLCPRFNPILGANGEEAGSVGLPSQVDPRQMSLLGAGWTVGSLKYLAESGVASVTYYETTGWRGVMETERGSLRPDRFHSLPGSVFPMYHIFADIGECVGFDVLPTSLTNANIIGALALRRAKTTRFIIANLTNSTQCLRVQNVDKRIWVRHLNETNVVRAMQEPEEWRATPGMLLESKRHSHNIELLPYAIAMLDANG